MDVSCSRAAEITVGSGLIEWFEFVCMLWSCCDDVLIIVGEIGLGRRFSGFAEEIIFQTRLSLAGLGLATHHAWS